MNKEELIGMYMEKLGLTRQEALQLYEDEQNDVVTEEMAEMEKKAKEVKRYEQSDKPRKKVVREKKTDVNKQLLMRLLQKGLQSFISDNKIIDFKVTNEERSFDFTFDDEQYTVTLTKHRAKKEV